MTMPTQAALTDAIYIATKAAVTDLFRTHADHDFYYVTLTTSGEANAPTLSAWSRQALAAAAKSAEDRAMLKWSYADSPFCDYGAAHFEEVRRLFDARPEMDADGPEEAWMAEYHLRVEAMVAALARLDGEGLFGRGERRARMVVLVEVMPPDASNTEVARRLNPPEALGEWLAEAAETDD